MAKIYHEYLLFGFQGEYMGTVYTLKEAKAHKERVKGIYYYRKQERLDDQGRHWQPSDDAS